MGTSVQTRTRDHKIHLKTYRTKLKCRREPYWRQVGEGKHIGYRKTASGSESWIARWTDDLGKYHASSLGPLSAFSFDEAVEKADRWFKQCGAGMIRSGTVEAACRDYVANRRVEIGERNAADAEKRFIAHLYDSALAPVKLDKLNARMVQRWRDALLAGSTPAHTKRTFKILRAALNHAYRLGEISSDAAWKRVSLSVGDEAENELEFYWTMAERRAFLERCPEDLRDFLTAIAVTGARPQEIATAVVDDVDLFSRKLILRHRKGYRSRLKARDFSLVNEGALALFRRVQANKLPQAPLLTRHDGSGWYTANGHAAWVAQVKKIRRDHHVDDRLTAYHFRHWAITDWLNAGIVSVNVATLAGTSIGMIERYYKKFVRGHVNDQLAEMDIL